MADPFETDFDEWLATLFGRAGSFTVLIFLIGIGENSVTPLRSTHLHVVGDEIRWPEMAALLSSAGVDWQAAAFFQADAGGLVDDMIAKQRLAALTRHLNEDRKLLNDSEFFDRNGLRLKLEQVVAH
jgi:hypothetical protein